jgi:hypothetical protein
MDIRKLSKQQRVILGQAASILEVPVPGLDRSLRETFNSPVAKSPLPEEHNPSPTYFQVSGAGSGLEYCDASIFEGDWENMPELNDPNGGEQADSTLCNFDSIFGFEIIPRQWSDCFASLDPVHQTSEPYESQQGKWKPSVSIPNSTS